MDDSELADILRRQYAATISMLHNAVTACPEDLWDRRADEAPFWQQAMHAIAAMHMYVLDPADGPDMAALRAKIERDLALAPAAEPLPDLDRVRRAIDVLPNRAHRPAATASKQALLIYLDDLSEACHAALMRPATFGIANSMAWSGPRFADRLVYNIRHAQHHVGRLHSILGRHGIRLPWLM
jgi:hypothetical protein